MNISKDLLKIIAGYEREEKLSYRYLIQRYTTIRWNEQTIHDTYESALKYIKEKHPDELFDEYKPNHKKIDGCEISYINFPSEQYMIIKLKSM